MGEAVNTTQSGGLVDSPLTGQLSDRFGELLVVLTPRGQEDLLTGRGLVVEDLEQGGACSDYENQRGERLVRRGPEIVSASSRSLRPIPGAFWFKSRTR